MSVIEVQCYLFFGNDWGKYWEAWDGFWGPFYGITRHVAPTLDLLTASCQGLAESERD